MPSKCYEFKSLGLKTNFETKKYSKARNIDRQFEERVKLYIQENKHKSIIDADTLVDSLRRSYPEYMRRQRAAVKYLAGRVIALLTDEDRGETSNQSGVVDENDERSNLSSISSDDEVSTISRVFLPSMDNTMAKLYKTSGSNTSSVSHEEFINISSDDDSAEEHRSNNVPTFTLEDDPQIGCTDTLIPRKRKLCDDALESTPTALTSSVDTTTNGVMRNNSTPIVHGSKKIKNRALNRLRNKPNEQKNISKVNESVITDPSNAYIPDITFANVAGCFNAISEIIPLLVNVYHPEVYNYLDIDPPRGILLHGPPGCGKTLLARAVAGELKVPLLDVAGPELVAGVSGISEQRIRKLFTNAIKLAPCILFIDEIDCITQNRDVANRDMEKRIVSQLLSSMDKLNRDAKGTQVLVIGATNRPDSLDPALRRAGRFDREVRLGIPGKESRYEILRLICSKFKLSDDVNLREIAAHTPGYVGADLLSLIRASTESAVQRVMELATDYGSEKPYNTEEDSNDSTGTIQCDMSVDSVSSTTQMSPDEKMKKMLSWIKNKTPIDEAFLEDVAVTMDDIKVALKRVQPSSKREGFATIPDVTWDDVGSLKDVRKTLKLIILGPLERPKLFNEVGELLSTGILFCGPPGCGKTLLAKAVANEAGINFISVKGPELLNMYVGGSEKAVRECFQRAKNSQPCVIFFDELDSLCPKRADHSENGVSMRVVNQLLTEMDGVEDRKGVFIMAATNRPDIIDPAVLRPGRLDKIIHVGFPNEDDRVDILQALTKKGTKPRLHESVNLAEVARNPLCDGFTGADLAALVRDASMIALRERISSNVKENDSLPLEVSATHFESALENLRPSVSEEDRNRYERLRLKFATSKYQLQKNTNLS